MSFISILKKVWTVVDGVESIAAKTGILNLIPGGAVVDAIFQIIPDSTAKAEAMNPMDKQGAVKEAVVVKDFEAGLLVTQKILDVDGKKLVYDEAALKEAIAGSVAMYNAMAKVQASFKVVPK